MLESPVSQMMVNFKFALFSLMQLDVKKLYIQNTFLHQVCSKMEITKYAL